jgi:hypothetical protein
MTTPLTNVTFTFAGATAKSPFWIAVELSSGSFVLGQAGSIVIAAAAGQTLPIGTQVKVTAQEVGFTLESDAAFGLTLSVLMTSPASPYGFPIVVTPPFEATTATVTYPTQRDIDKTIPLVSGGTTPLVDFLAKG